MKQTYTLFLLLIGVMFSSLHAQRYKPYAEYFSGAELLAMQGIDTTNIILIRSIADTSRLLTDDAYLFLLQHGYTEYIPLAKQRIKELINNDEANFTFSYLAGLYAVRDPETLPYARMILDSVLVQKQEHRSMYDMSFDIVHLIEVLISYGDYSRYSLFKHLPSDEIAQNTKLFRGFAQNAQLRDDVYQTFLPYLSYPNNKYRYYAVRTLYGLKEMPNRYNLLKEKALTDSSAEIRDIAISYLMYDYDDLNTAITGSEKLVMDFQNSFSWEDSIVVNAAIDRLSEQINSIYAYAALARLAALYPQSEAPSELRYYYPDKNSKYYSMSVLALIDSLKSSTQSAQLFNWLGNANFVKELTNHLTNAKKHLGKQDSLKCAQEVEKFQSKVDKEYKKANIPTSGGKGGRFVTIEGWKFLYYNAQYIIDRLVALPAKSQGTLLQQIDELKAELQTQNSKKNIGGALLVKSLTFLTDQAKKQLQKPLPSTNDSATATLSIAAFQLFVDEIWELTEAISGKNKKLPALYVYDEAYIQLHYRAKYMLEQLPAPRTLIDMKSVQMDDDVRKEFDAMQRMSKEQ